MPSEVALVYFFKTSQFFNAQLLVMSKKLRTFALRNNVQTIIHEHPLGDPADCVRYVRKAKEDEGAQLSQQTIARALKETLEYIQCKRHWFAVFAVLRDLQVVGGLNEFTDLLSEIMGEEAPDLNLKDLGRLNVLSFRKPIAQWDEADAITVEIRLQTYLDIAKRFRKALL